jgi:hypothetical protein
MRRLLLMAAVSAGLLATAGAATSAIIEQPCIPHSLAYEGPWPFCPNSPIPPKAPTGPIKPLKAAGRVSAAPQLSGRR